EQKNVLWLEHYIAAIKNKPLTLYRDVHDADFYQFEDASWRTLREEGLAYSHIASLDNDSADTIANIISSEGMLDYFCSEETLNNFDKPYSYDLELQKYFEEKWPEEKFQPNYLHLLVSLSATNEQLVDQFKQWLHVARKKFYFTESKLITPNKLAKIRNGKVLPYCDLFIWSKLKKFEVTNFLYYKWLFPKGDHFGSSATNKIIETKKLAMKVLTVGYVSTLRGMLDLGSKTK
ncbi:MAG: DUF6387 family protein, partial [Nitrosomonas sp.]|nr:DUF6387 family protein [Nitrosomonas sp.]